MIHELRIPDVINGRELRPVIWDDEAGTVEGGHYDVPLLRRRFAEAPSTHHREFGSLTLLDPAHSAADFLALLFMDCYSPRLAEHLPPSLAGVEPTHWRMAELPQGHIA